MSFLSKLRGNKKKDLNDEVVVKGPKDSAAVGPDGPETPPFVEPELESQGSVPGIPQAPTYIKVRSRHKPKPEFDHLFLAQELHPRRKRKADRIQGKLRRKGSVTASDAENTIWAIGFSRDGKYFAAAGADPAIRVWQVLASPQDRARHEMQEESMAQSVNSFGSTSRLSAPVFQRTPARLYEGHTATVLDLSWSKNNFLLTSSMDKTVRLWHVTRKECLCTFKHNDFVPSIAFHPKDDRFFVTGSLDSKLRLWSIPDKSVAYIATVPDMITAVAFTPDGKFAIVGCFSGLVMFFETEGLKYQSQMNVTSSRGIGAKVTGLETRYSSTGDVKVLVTSNDSRIRVVNFRDKSLEVKLKGNQNNCSQIRASLSDCGRYVSCGSEDRRAYIWSLRRPPAGGEEDHDVEERKEKRGLEYFEAGESITTAVCVAPRRTREALARSEDPIFDLCNPPPVTLMSKEEREGSTTSSMTWAGSAMSTPADPQASYSSQSQHQTQSYLANAGHEDGNIVVTADFTGLIKVFRQDCAWRQRGNNSRRESDWDRASIFTRSGAGRSSRAGSLATRASQRSLRDRANVTIGCGERIMTWRQGIASTSALARKGSVEGSGHSVSPHGSLKERIRSIPTPERRGSVKKRSADHDDDAAPVDECHDSGNGDKPIVDEFDPTNTSGKIDKPEPGPDLYHGGDDNPMRIVNGQSYTYWDTTQYRDKAEQLRKLHLEQSYVNGNHEALSRITSTVESVNGGNGHLAVRPAAQRAGSYVSQLSDERSASETESEEAEAGRESRGGQGRGCKQCGGRFGGLEKGLNGELGAGQKLVCERCGHAQHWDDHGIR